MTCDGETESVLSSLIHLVKCRRRRRDIDIDKHCKELLHPAVDGRTGALFIGTTANELPLSLSLTLLLLSHVHYTQSGCRCYDFCFCVAFSCRSFMTPPSALQAATIIKQVADPGPG